MIKRIKPLKIITKLELLLEHPIKNFGDVSMFISKCEDSDTYIFSIPRYNWVYTLEKGNEIKIFAAPSGFNHPNNKLQLIHAMQYAISLIENNE